MNNSNNKPRLQILHQPTSHYSMRQDKDRTNRINSVRKGTSITLKLLGPVCENGQIIVVCVCADSNILHPNILKGSNCLEAQYFATYKFEIGQSEVPINNLTIKRTKQSDFNQVLRQYQENNINPFNVNDYNAERKYDTNKLRLCFIPYFNNLNTNEYDVGDPVVSNIISNTSDGFDIVEIIPKRGRPNEKICFKTSKGKNKEGVEARFFNDNNEIFKTVERQADNIFFVDIPEGFADEIVQVQLAFDNRQSFSDPVAFVYDNKIDTLVQQEQQRVNLTLSDNYDHDYPTQVWTNDLKRKRENLRAAHSSNENRPLVNTDDLNNGASTNDPEDSLNELEKFFEEINRKKAKPSEDASANDTFTYEYEKTLNSEPNESNSVYQLSNSANINDQGGVMFSNADATLNQTDAPQSISPVNHVNTMNYNQVDTNDNGALMYLNDATVMQSPQQQCDVQMNSTNAANNQQLYLDQTDCFKSIETDHSEYQGDHQQTTLFDNTADYVSLFLGGDQLNLSEDYGTFQYFDIA